MANLKNNINRNDGNFSHTLYYGVEGIHIGGAYKGNTRYLSLRHLCEALGLNVSAQLKKLQEMGSYNTRQLNIVVPDGRQLPQMVIAEEHVAGWLISVNENKVSEAIRDRFIYVKKQLLDLLGIASIKKFGANPGQHLMSMIQGGAADKIPVYTPFPDHGMSEDDFQQAYLDSLRLTNEEFEFLHYEFHTHRRAGTTVRQLVDSIEEQLFADGDFSRMGAHAINAYKLATGQGGLKLVQ